MSAKFFVHGGGRWRELDAETGCVSGWGVVQFVCYRRGRLHVTRRRRVLAALSALAAGVTTGPAKDGPRLSLYREFEETIPVKQKQQIQDEHHHCCCGHSKPRCDNVEQKRINPSQNLQLKHKVDASTQMDTAHCNTIVTEAEVYPRPNRKRKYSDSSSENSNSVAVHKYSPKKTANFTSQVVRRHSDTSSDSLPLNKLGQNKRKMVKELIINEEDIAVLRSYIENNTLFSDIDLLKFDETDEYKRYVFYRLNPLVRLEPCPAIEKMLLERASSQDDIVTLDDFATQLGLQNVKSVKETTRYKMRRRVVRSPKKNYDRRMNNLNGKRSNKENYKDTVISSSSSSSDNEISKKVRTKLNKNKTFKLNNIVHIPNKNTRKDFSDSSDTSNDDKENRRASNPEQKRTRTSIDKHIANAVKVITDHRVLRDKSLIISSDSETDRSEAIQQKTLPTDPRSSNRTNKKPIVSESNDLVKKPTSFFFKKRSGSPQKRVVSKAAKLHTRPAPRSGRTEYSASEDAAIVRWVRGGGGRERKVNGNLIWRQLETEYPALTGHKRSWHSLRNRYLRSVLPSLHRLPLSLNEAAALRAAAADGELKRRPKKRHSLFPEPATGAASRKPNARKLPERDSPPRATRKSARLDSSLNKSGNQSPLKSALKANVQTSSPTYSELTKRFALRVRSTKSETPNSSSVKDGSVSPNKSVRFEDQAKRKTRKLYNP